MEVVGRACIRPRRSLDLLSHREVANLMASKESVLELFRQCALAVLNCGSVHDNGAQIFEDYPDFRVEVISQSRGLRLDVYNAPASAFVDGKMITGIQEHLFSVLRDIVYTHHKIDSDSNFEFSSTDGTTDGIFRILRNAEVVRPNLAPNTVVCWGGHSINTTEYDYTKEVGYELGLRKVDIITGCGIGAMKGPMKGAAVGHAKQRYGRGRYIGVTEPGIVASEPPNPIVNELIILPDIEKRLEAFVRLAHVIVVFPGGAGTVEEVLYILSLKMAASNKGVPLPIIFSAPSNSEAYFEHLDRYIRATLGDEATQHYEIINADPQAVAKHVKRGLEKVHNYRRKKSESYCFNWELEIDQSLQKPFDPSHENMAALRLDTDSDKAHLAAELRKAFSGIVAGNVKPYGIAQVAKHGPYQIRGNADLLEATDKLLLSFIEQGRMKLGVEAYSPCYEISR